MSEQMRQQGPGSGRPMPSVRVRSDLAYMRDGAEKHRLDICWSREAIRPMPAIVVFNDDSFLRSSRAMTSELCQSLAQRGFAVVNCDFRDLSEGVGIREQISDALAVLRFVSRGSKTYGIDMGEVYSVGCSYGALMALWTTLVCNTGRLRAALGAEDPGVRIRGTGLISGITDIGHRSARMAAIRAAVRSAEADGGVDLADSLVPETNHDLRTMGPVFQVTSTDDSSLRDCRKLKGLLDTNAVANRLMVFDSSEQLPRGFVVKGPERPESVRAVSSMIRFLGCRLGGAGCGPSGSS